MFGPPVVLNSDNGLEFCNAVVLSLANLHEVVVNSCGQELAVVEDALVLRTRQLRMHFELGGRGAFFLKYLL